jgi:hypothetical protein
MSKKSNKSIEEFAEVLYLEPKDVTFGGKNDKKIDYLHTHCHKVRVLLYSMKNCGHCEDQNFKKAFQNVVKYYKQKDDTDKKTKTTIVDRECLFFYIKYDPSKRDKPYKEFYEKTMQVLGNIGGFPTILLFKKTNNMENWKNSFTVFNGPRTEDGIKEAINTLLK